MSWQFNPYIIPFLFGAIPVVYATLVAWRRRDYLPERIFFWLTLAVLWATVIYVIELCATDPTLMLVLRQLQYFGGLPTSVLMFLFAAAQTGREQLITRRNVLLLLAVPVLYWLLVWTNESHHLHWQKLEVVKVDGLFFLAQTYSSNWIFWLRITYTYSLILASFYLIFSKLITATTPFRNQYWLLLIALLVPWVMNIIEVTGLNPVRHLALVLYGILFSCLPLAWALFRHYFLDLTPAAQDMVMRSIEDAVFVVDRTHRVVDVNPAGARWLGRDLQQIIGQPAQQIFASILSKGEAFEQLFTAPKQITRKTGETEQFYNVRVSPLYNQWGQINGRVISIHDLLHQKQAERQAVALALEQEKVKLLQQFIDASSHDLSTPLTTLLMSVQLLKHNTAQAPAHLRYLAENVVTSQADAQRTIAKLEKLVQAIDRHGERINLSIQRLQTLLAGMLELAQHDKEFALSPTISDLNQVIHEVVSEMAPVFQARHLEILVESALTRRSVLLDQKEFRRVMKHLLQNASNFTAANGRICIKTYYHTEQVVVEISDNGRGIDPEDLPFIFDRFYRGDKARSAETGGIGVGLAIVKKIVSAHKGQVEVESTPGKGATFRVKLPTAGQ